MAILDKLIEKKDLMNYLNLRIIHLRSLKKDIKKYPADERQDLIKRWDDKIEELKRLKDLTHSNIIKEDSKSLWRLSQD